MGSTYSEPLLDVGSDVVCVVLRQPNVARIVAAPQHLIKPIVQIVRLVFSN